MIKLAKVITLCYKASERNQARRKICAYLDSGYSLEVTEDEISGNDHFPLAVQLLKTTTLFSDG